MTTKRFASAEESSSSRSVPNLESKVDDGKPSISNVSTGFLFIQQNEDKYCHEATLYDSINYGVSTLLPSDFCENLVISARIYCGSFQNRLNQQYTFIVPKHGCIIFLTSLF